MSLGTNGAAAAQLEDPNHENEFEAAQKGTVADAEAHGTEAEAAVDPAVSLGTDVGQLMAAAASDSPAAA